MVCSRCKACVHGSWFGYMWDACELCWFGYRWCTCELCWFWLQVGCLWVLVSLATGVTPVSWWPLVTIGQLRCNVMVSSCLGIGAFLNNWTCYKLTYHYFLHLLSSNHKSTHPCYNAAQKLKMRWTTTMKISSRSLRCPWSIVYGDWCVLLLLNERVDIVFCVKTISHVIMFI
jgi:hypothetical protein